MNLSDETLSAFLDAELPEHDMEKVRMALIEDEAIAERLAELAMVDAMVKDHYQAIVQQPIPAATQALLADAEPVATNPVIDNSVTDNPVKNNVVEFPWWRKAQQQVQQYAAAIAVIALIAGYGVYQIESPTQSQTSIAAQNDLWLQQEINEQLTQLPSGVDTMLDNDSVMTVELSFYNQQGQLCRQYAVQNTTQKSHTIACAQQGQWQQVASLEYNTHSNNQSGQQAQYQTASAGSPLDEELDKLMADAPLTVAQEQQALQQLVK
ncbi:hypothetical protein L2703_07090 [Shewanella basaltis]|uniref:anti-sigma factor family protein n=1 Tax=Shewanella basaltis TaxID=472183 RepID=UPI00200F1BD1|nr:hypothetical protein [Shewanella basaltis]MCL1113363.1 hypothetical protein [Shewanella basaltis]